MREFSPAVFLDRDGTLIEDVGAVTDEAQIELYDWTIDALRRLREAGFKLFVVSNQDKVASGELTMAEVERIHRWLDEFFCQHGIEITRWYVCPHGPRAGCQCRKPSPFFLHQAAEEFDLDLSRSFMIGDHAADVRAGRAAGACGLYLLTGHGIRHLATVPDDFLVFRHLGDAVDWILKYPRGMVSLQQAIAEAAACIRAGKLVVFPTETVYGLGADAFNATAVADIFAAKQRPLADPLIVHIADRAQLNDLVQALPAVAERLCETFWPGPLTLVLEKNKRVPDLVTAGLPTVGVRMPSHPVAAEFLRQCRCPVAAPSANRFMATSPTHVDEAAADLSGAVEFFLDGGCCRVGVESTVVAVRGDCVQILRQGGVSEEELRAALSDIPSVRWIERSEKPLHEAAPAPGMFKRHYAPVKPMFLVRDLTAYTPQQGDGLILPYHPAGKTIDSVPVRILAPHGNDREAAVNLYRCIRELDAEPAVRRIVAQPLPDTGLGRAVNERLEKAAAGKWLDPQ